MDTTGASDEGFQRLPDTQFTASVFGGSGDRKKEMLRKKYHVVRKKNHVVRKIFYVASIFGGAAGRKNRPPWKKLPTAWELSSMAGYVFPTASTLFNYYCPLHTSVAIRRKEAGLSFLIGPRYSTLKGLTGHPCFSISQETCFQCVYQEPVIYKKCHPGRTAFLSINSIGFYYVAFHPAFSRHGLAATGRTIRCR